ncbi:MAG: imidazole glycerol phosphate synthase subunit HisH [Actinomycetota bacterium]
MISIIDCEIGNLRSVQKAFEFIGIKAAITSDEAEILSSRAVVLPGVGAFRDAIAFLRETSLDAVIRKVVDAGTPFLGICLGMQMFADRSEEGGRLEGLGLINGQVVKLPDTEKIPEMGWNEITVTPGIPIFKDIPARARFYFAHSYYFLPDYDRNIAATTHYGLTYASAVYKGNVFGTQFHPEKSGEHGLQVLRNFAGLTACG